MKNMIKSDLKLKNKVESKVLRLQDRNMMLNNAVRRKSVVKNASVGGDPAFCFISLILLHYNNPKVYFVL